MRAVLLLMFIFPSFIYAKSDCRITKNETTRLISLDYKKFDQNMDGGWRKWGYLECYTIAAEILDKYLSIHKEKLLSWQLGIIIWHAGQMYAFKGDYKLAKDRFIKSVRANEPKDTEILWNDYVYGSIAFLEKDLKELQRRRDIIASGPSLNGKKANLNIMDNFLKCPNRPYKVAYSGCIIK